MSARTRPLAAGLALAVLAAVFVGPATAVAPHVVTPNPTVAAPVAGGDADALGAVRVDVVTPANRSNDTDPDTGVTVAVEAGSTLRITGTTDRRPDDNAIDISVIDGPDADRFGFAVVDSWETDGVWTTRIDVPANVTPGTYVLEARVGRNTDVQTFEVVERRRASVESAFLRGTPSDVAGERIPAGTVGVANVTLPDGGHVTVRGDGGVVGRSAALDPGTHPVVVVPIEGAGDDLRAVAVRGAPEADGEAYRSDGATVGVPVEVDPDALEPATSSATPTATASPTTPTMTQAPTPTPTAAGTTPGAAPGFGVVAAFSALVVVVVGTLRRR